MPVPGFVCTKQFQWNSRQNQSTSFRKCSRSSPQVMSCGISSLSQGTWFKLICGASSQDAPSIRNLCEVYTAAGVDCIDISASKPIIQAARAGIAAGMRMVDETNAPLLMVSINDDSDPHFRKAVFQPRDCLQDCSMPCAAVCPADAINVQGVMADVCYGCGRCLPVCPVGIIDAVEYTHPAEHVREVLRLSDALEIHTGPGHLVQFDALWDDIGDAASELAVVAVSLPSLGDDDAIGDALVHMERTLANVRGEIIWQTDGRPMSGDIGRGTASRAVQLARRVRGMLDKRGVRGHVQLAGGTNDATVGLMRKAGLLRSEGCTFGTASGIAVGGYARKIVKHALGDEFDAARMSTTSFHRAVGVARKHVQQLKVAERILF